MRAVDKMAGLVKKKKETNNQQLLRAGMISSGNYTKKYGNY